MRFLQRKLLRSSKGITLIELIVSIGITTTIISMILPTFLKFNFLYNKLIISDRNYSYVIEAMLDIQNQITLNTLNVNINENKIVINKLDKTVKKIYFVPLVGNLGNVCVSTYKLEDGIHKDIMLADIRSFNVAVKGNLIYLKIITSDGKSFERCLYLKI